MLTILGGEANGGYVNRNIPGLITGAHVVFFYRCSQKTSVAASLGGSRFEVQQPTVAYWCDPCVGVDSFSLV